MAIYLITKHFKPFGFLRPDGKTAAEAQQTSIAKWRRRDGQASFLCDLIELHKTLALCNNCAKIKMPRKWQSLYLYEKLTTFHGEDFCDYCRQEGPISLYMHATDSVWPQMHHSMEVERRVRKRERELWEKNPGHFAGVVRR
jgi:hypothetical protein